MNNQNSDNTSNSSRSSSSNYINVPEARQAMDQFKMQIANYAPVLSELSKNRPCPEN